MHTVPGPLFLPKVWAQVNPGISGGRCRAEAGPSRPHKVGCSPSAGTPRSGTQAVLQVCRSTGVQAEPLQEPST